MFYNVFIIKKNSYSIIHLVQNFDKEKSMCFYSIQKNDNLFSIIKIRVLQWKKIRIKLMT